MQQLPTKKALAIAPVMKINTETMISVTPMPNKPCSQTFEIISVNPSICIKNKFLCNCITELINYLPDLNVLENKTLPFMINWL